MHANRPLHTSHSAEFIISNAEILLQHEDYVLARQLYSHVLHANPKNESALKGLGVCFRSLGDYSSAKRCFRAVFDFFSNEASYLWIAQTLLMEKKEQEALNVLTRIRNPQELKDSEKVDYYRELGNAYYRLGNIENAEKMFRLGLAIAPQCALLLTNLGMLEIQSSHFEMAAGYLLRALHFNPKNAKAYAGLASVAVEANQINKAKGLLEKALEFDPQNKLALLQLAEIASPGNECQRVQLYFKKALELNPLDSDIRFVLATLFLKESQWRACEQELDRILNQTPSHVRAQQLKSELLVTRFSS